MRCSEKIEEKTGGHGMRDIISSNEILTREEVMEILKIGRSTFYRLLQTGELKGFKEGNKYKVPAQSIDEYVRKRLND